MSGQPLSPPVRTPPFTPARRPTPGRSGFTVGEIGEGTIGGLNAVAVGAAALPGFLLTVPGFVLVLLPVIAIGILAAVAVLVVVLATIPMFVGWRIARRARRALPALRVPRVPRITRRIRPTAGRPAL